MVFKKSSRPRRYHLPEGHPTIPSEKIGVIILNLGTPDGHSYWPMRRYLKEFLSDRRVIDLNPLKWWIILNLFVLTKRPFKSGAAYREIWNQERDESPLKTITRAQAEKIERHLKKTIKVPLMVDWAMRYGNPSVESRINALKDAGCTKILFFALYPQYSAPTTATAFDQCFKILQKMRWQPAIRTSPPYHDEDLYISALANSIKAKLKTLPWKPEMILTSFHGVPKRFLTLGDPYHCQCQKTGRLLREKLKWPMDKFMVTFQSRFGPEEWLQPYTDETIEGLAKKGVKNLLVICPGFSSDCLETLEEIEGENQEIFHHHGGENFAYVPCLNDSADHITLLSRLITRELEGWV